MEVMEPSYCNCGPSLFSKSIYAFIYHVHQLVSKMKHLVSCFLPRISHNLSAPITLAMSLYRFLAFCVSPFYLQLFYFIIISLFGFLGLKTLNPTHPVPPRPSDLDLFFTSVSASTVSSMIAVEMEAFSNSQLILIIFLMFLGGEVFTSMIGLVFSSFSLSQKQSLRNRVASPQLKQNPSLPTVSQIEMGLVSPYIQNEASSGDNIHSDTRNIVQDDEMKRNSIKCLGFVVLGYLMILPLIGSGMVSSYMSMMPSAAQVLRDKGINTHTFSVFAIVSTFSSCGFVPTNESMFLFKHNPGLLLLILPFVFLGNTLYAPCLRLVIWVLERVIKRQEFCYMQRNYEEMGYEHMLCGVRCLWLVATVLGLNLMQLVLLCCMEWRRENMEGLTSYEKLVSSLFQVSNARHAGESVFHVYALSPAILVLFLLMMYLPPYTTFLPMSRSMKKQERDDEKGESRSVKECLLFSQPTYLVIFIILICIIESKSLREDPINFNVFNVTLEVISAYGNVGFSMGYSCKMRLEADGDGECRDEWVGFVGRWSNKGKFMLILVMFFGRLKKFNITGGKAWLLS